MKTAIAILFSLIVVAVSAALILPSFVDWNQYKGDITDQANKATGRRLTIFGDISLAVLPSPTLKVADVRLANSPGGDAQNMVSLKALEVHVALWPLLSSEIQVQSIRLIEPVIALEIDKDGIANWDFGRAGGAAPASGGGEAGGLAGFSLDSLFIEKGSLTFVDATSGFSERIDGLTTEISAKSLEGPFVAKGNVTAHGLALGFDTNIGRVVAGSALPLMLDLDVGKGTGKVSIKGSLSRPDAEGEFKGKASISGAEAMALVRMLAGAGKVPVGDISGLKQAISLRSDVIATAAELGLNNLELKLGETTATGAVNATLGAVRQVDVALDVNRVDLNSWIATETAEADKPEQSEDKQKAASDPFAIPTDLSGTLNINVNALAFKGSSIRQFETSASIAGGVVTIERVAAHLPGGAAVDVVGTIASVKGLPQFEGGVRASADNLRGLLSWVGVDLKDIPQDRLRGTSLSATVRGTPELLEIYGIDLRLDSSTLTGGAAYAFRERPAFSVDFAIDQLNVDAYRAPGDAATADKSTSAGDTSGPELSALPPEVIDVLDSFDTNVKVAVRKLNLNAVPIKGVVVDVGLLGGAVTVRDIKADDLGGATFSFKGDAQNLGTKPGLNGIIDIQAANATGLARLANVVLPVPAERLGAVRATGKIAGNTERLDLDLKVLAAKTTTGLTGEINLARAATRLNLGLKADNRSYVGLWRVFDPDFKLAAGGRDGPLSISGTMSGDIKALGVDLKVAFGAANLTAAGKLSPTGTASNPGPTYNLALKAAHPDAPAFLQGLGIDYHPATANFGALVLSADISGTTTLAQIGNLDGKFGPVAMAGSISAQVDGRRPSITANLATSEILVDLFLPRSKSNGKSTPSQGRGERWSTDPIDLEGLNSIDLVLDLQSKGITYGAYRFANPQVKATIKDGVLRINPLTGQLFEGAVNLTAELRDDQVPSVNMSIDLSGANIHEALVKAAGVDAVTGQAGFNGQFSATGHSQKAMISRLSGKANFAAQNGIVQGVDLQRLSDRLKSLDRTVDFLSLINATMNGGETAYSRLGGTFNVQNGVARSEDLSATLQAGAGSGRAVIDLPRWLVDMTASFRLTEHAKAPPIGLVLRGPLDAPQRDVKSKDMENFVAQRVGGTLIRKLLGKKAGGLGSLLTGGGATQNDAPPPPSQPIQQQQQPSDGLAPPPILLPQEPEQQQQQPGDVKPKDVLKGLLKGLIK
jgi:uncharacterized protein involved in outer membrane biogenesis